MVSIFILSLSTSSRDKFSPCWIRSGTNSENILTSIHIRNTIVIVDANIFFNFRR